MTAATTAAAATTKSTWLEVIEPSASMKQIMQWRADPMIPGVRISLDGRSELGVGRLATDDLKAGTNGDDKHYCRLRKSLGKASHSGWVIVGPRSTTVNGAPLSTTPKHIESGDVVDGGTFTFRFQHDVADPLLGVAWRLEAAPYIAFPTIFPKVRRFRALALDGGEPRLCSVVVDHEPTRTGDALGRVVHRWSNALVVEVPLVDGPTLRQLFDKSRALGAVVDATFLAEMCATVEGVVASLDDVVVGFDGSVRSSSLHKASNMPAGTRLRRLLEAMKRPVADEAERAGPDALAGLLRHLFPDEAHRTETIAEEALLLSCDGWRERVPSASASSKRDPFAPSTDHGGTLSAGGDVVVSVPLTAQRRRSSD